LVLLIFAAQQRRLGAVYRPDPTWPPVGQGL